MKARLKVMYGEMGEDVLDHVLSGDEDESEEANAEGICTK